MPTIRRCCIVGCMSNSRQNPQLQFFQFPRPDNPFHKLWKQACHASLSRILPFKKPVVCALHFHPNCIGGRRLTSSAVPSLRLEVPSNLKAVEQQAMLEEIEKSRKCAFINAVVYEWIVRANLNPQLRGSITHGMIKEKAENAKQLIGSSSFMADNRWLNRFRETHLTGFAQKLASNQLKPLGPSLRIPDIVQDLQHLFPPTTAERMANIEEMPEQYISYMQEYGEFEEEDESNESKESSYLEQQQQQAQYHYQQQFGNGPYDSAFGQAAAFGSPYDQYSYERQQQQHHQQLQQQHYQQGHHNPYHPQYHHQQYQQQQQQQHHHLQQQHLYSTMHDGQQTNYSSSASSQRSASRTPPNQGSLTSPRHHYSPSTSPSNRHHSPSTPSSSAVKRPRIETPSNGTRSPSNTRTPTPSGQMTVSDAEPKAEPEPENEEMDVTNDLTGDNDDDEEVPVERTSGNDRSATPSHSQNNGDSSSLKSESVSRSGSVSHSSAPTPVNENSNDNDPRENENDRDNDDTSDTEQMNGNATPNGHNSSRASSPAAAPVQNGRMNGHSNGHVNGLTNGHHNGSASPLSSFSSKDLESYSEALEYLKPLEDFALLKENFRAIGLISQLEAVLRKGVRIPLHHQAS